MMAINVILASVLLEYPDVLSEANRLVHMISRNSSYAGITGIRNGEDKHRIICTSISEALGDDSKYCCYRYCLSS